MTTILKECVCLPTDRNCYLPSPLCHCRSQWSRGGEYLTLCPTSLAPGVWLSVASEEKERQASALCLVLSSGQLERTPAVVKEDTGGALPSPCLSLMHMDFPLDLGRIRELSEARR